MDVTLSILGSGTSHGIPMIACDCAVCTSTDPRDKRTRCAAVIQANGATLLIDTPPEFRLQCIAADLRRIDAVLFTHGHADHVVGMDDLRRFNWLAGRALGVYATPATLEVIMRMFPYAFAEDPEYPSAKPRLVARELHHDMEIEGVPVTLVPAFHGELPVLGFRVGDIAYLTDVNRIPSESMAKLNGLDVLVLDALRRRPHPTHFNLEQAIAKAAEIGARNTYFTHIAHELAHAEVEAELPEGMHLTYDGLVVRSGRE